jgi:predicted Zn-dependent peptidase
VLFHGHALGHKILGTEETVSSFSKTDFTGFLQQNLDCSRIMLTSLSSLSTAEIKKLADKHLKDIPAYAAPFKRKPYATFEPRQTTIIKPIQQAHCMLGGLGFSFTDEERLPFFMLINLLGGPGMTSRLNMKLREKNGLVYTVESAFAPYSDTGQYHFYFATEKSRLEKSLKLLFEEIKLVKEKALGTLQLHQTKEQLMGQIAMAEENNLSLMLTIGKSLLDSGKMESLPQLFQKINAMKASHLLELANRVFESDQMSMVTFLPED